LSDGRLEEMRLNSRNIERLSGTINWLDDIIEKLDEKVEENKREISSLDCNLDEKLDGYEVDDKIEDKLNDIDDRIEEFMSGVMRLNRKYISSGKIHIFSKAPAVKKFKAPAVKRREQ
jgi:predicted RNase H-like nuclease (RuvC/YqgF family)